jgi:hypothetical protein
MLAETGAVSSVNFGLSDKMGDTPGLDSGTGTTVGGGCGGGTAAMASLVIGAGAVDWASPSGHSSFVTRSNWSI